MCVNHQHYFLTILFLIFRCVHIFCHAHQRCLLYCLKDYWSQPARQIVRRYRQRQQQQQQQALAAFSDASTSDGVMMPRSLPLHMCDYPDCGKLFNHKHNLLRHQARKHKTAAVSDASSDGLMPTTSLQVHTCDYPDCGKQFSQKRNLQRHQTQKHGRTPTRILGLQRVWMTPSNINNGHSFSSTGTVP